jgi:hypothetical protein
VSGLHRCILDLVCGLAPSKRAGWQIMALQAYADDSLEAGRVLVLAGYISTAEKWSAFSKEWEQGLTLRQSLPFKMSEIDLESEQQMEYVRYLYRVIEQHVDAQVGVAINCEELAKWVPEMDVQQRLVNPYLLGHKAIINVTAQLQRQAGLTDKIDFIFDKRSEASKIQRGFDYYLTTLTPEFEEVTGNPPIFRDDKEFLPLQAADLLAWWMRRQWLTEGTIANRWVRYPWPYKRDFPSIVLDLSGDELRRELEEIQAHRQERRRPQMTLKVTFSSDLGRKDGGEKGGASS